MHSLELSLFVDYFCLSSKIKKDTKRAYALFLMRLVTNGFRQVSLVGGLFYCYLLPTTKLLLTGLIQKLSSVLIKLL